MLGEMAQEPEIREVFEALAAAEQGHRAKLEGELDLNQARSPD
jgi:rubrerythrin